MNIVLHQPEIPHNTGAIGRTALVAGARLHLIHPLGFFLDEKNLKRSGLDYWHEVDVSQYDSFEDFLGKNTISQMFFAETGSGLVYTEVKYQRNCFLVFGNETTGLPKNMLERYKNHIISIPMAKGKRSLNLSVAVGVVLYEALRQTGFGYEV